MKTVAVLMCVLFSAACGTTYYVATTGNDTNPGTLDRPWRKVGKAASTMVAGDSVLVRGGVYFESVNPAQSGTESDPITYSAYDTESVFVDGSEVVTGWVQDSGNRYRASVNFTCDPRFSTVRDPNGNYGGLVTQNGAKLQYAMEASPAAVDSPGEYYMNDSLSPPFTLYVNVRDLGAGLDPNNYEMRVGRRRKGFDLDGGKDWLVVEDLTFRNYNDNAIHSIGSTDCTFRGLTLHTNFITGIYLTGGSYRSLIEKCSFWDNGHGGASGIYMSGGTVPFFESADADALTNGDKTGIHVSIACDCAAWDRVAGGDCLAEHMVMRVGGGCIATIMNTRSGFGAIGQGGGYVPGPSERLDTTFYAGVIEYGKPHTGEALGYSKACWAPYADSLYQYDKQRYCIYDLSLIGDPETPLWTADPTALDVSHAGVVNIGVNIPYPVTVTTALDAPVESAMVCLRKGDEVDVRGWTDAGGQATLYVSATTPGQMFMAVNAHDHYLFQDTVQVIFSARHVSYLSSSILDPSPGGNGDSVINPGESFRIPTWVKNYGTQTATGVTGRLGTATAGAIITDSIKSFGDVPGGDSVQNTEGFAMTVDDDLPDGYAIRCSLVCKDVNDSTWISYVTFHVGAPLITFVDKAVKDSAGSCPNGKLDPGETADLEVTLRNVGLGNATNVQAVLKSGDARLTVPDTFAVYGTIPHESTAVNRTDHFTLHADAGIPPETPVTCTLFVTGDGGYAVILSFGLVVGETRTIDPIPDGPRTPAMYWAYDEADTGYAKCPTFNWIDIAGVGTQMDMADDETRVVGLPAGFGPFRYYGQNYTQVSICSNGFVAPGSTTFSSHTNTSLPDGSAPAMLAVNWDDLYPPFSNDIWYYHDAANHRFIVQWDSMFYPGGSVFEWFQIVLYDTTLKAADGNCEFVYQYLTANQTSSATIGMQDPTHAIGITELFNGTYTRGASPWVPGHAVKFTTDEPLTAVSEPARGVNLTRKPLEVSPNPFNASARINWQMKREGTAELKVYDAGGRVVRTLASGPHAVGSYTTAWNGTDNAGRKLARGIYFVRLATPDQTIKVKTVLAR